MPEDNFSDITVDGAVSTKGDFKEKRADASPSAKRKAKGKLRETNKHEWQCDLSVIGNLSIVAGMTFVIAGYKVYDGTYMADTVEHHINGSGGFTTDISAHRVLKGY